MDDDLVFGRKGVLDFLCLSDWEAVVIRIKNEGLPVEKIGGRIEMSKRKYCAWRDNIKPGKGIVEDDHK